VDNASEGLGAACGQLSAPQRRRDTLSCVIRPTLIPGLPRHWRARSDLQVGEDPARAILIHLADPRAVRLLDLLDGSRPVSLVLHHAAGQGVAPADAQLLLDTLAVAGLLVPGPALAPPDLPARYRCEAAALAHASRSLPHPYSPPAQRAAEPSPSRAGAPTARGRAPADDANPTPAQIMRRRSTARVVISGRGRLGAPIAVALAEAGVGHLQLDTPGTVQLGDLPGSPLHDADLGSPRREAIAAAVTRAAPDAKLTAARRTTAAMVVQLGHDQPVSLLAAAHAARRQPHLAVTLREGVAILGPYVPPTGAPCLNCLDLHRRDRDPQWPGTPIPTRDPIPEPAAVAVVLTAAAYATAEILTVIDGGTPETLGAAVEISAPTRIRRRTWPPHPDCSCARPRRS
jgi:hypothetical protein